MVTLGSVISLLEKSKSISVVGLFSYIIRGEPSFAVT